MLFNTSTPPTCSTVWPVPSLAGFDPIPETCWNTFWSPIISDTPFFVSILFCSSTYFDCLDPDPICYLLFWLSSVLNIFLNFMSNMSTTKAKVRQMLIVPWRWDFFLYLLVWERSFWSIVVLYQLRSIFWQFSTFIYFYFLHSPNLPPQLFGYFSFLIHNWYISKLHPEHCMCKSLSSNLSNSFWLCENYQCLSKCQGPHAIILFLSASRANLNINTLFPKLSIFTSLTVRHTGCSTLFNPSRLTLLVL